MVAVEIQINKINCPLTQEVGNNNSKKGINKLTLKVADANESM